MAKGFEIIDSGHGAGCGFLTDAEIDAYFSGDLDAERSTAFSAHQSEGCRPCSLFVKSSRQTRRRPVSPACTRRGAPNAAFCNAPMRARRRLAWGSLPHVRPDHLLRARVGPLQIVAPGELLAGLPGPE